MNNQIKNMIEKFKSYLEQPLLLNSELEAIKSELKQIIKSDPKIFDQVNTLIKTVNRAQASANKNLQKPYPLAKDFFKNTIPINFLVKNFPPELLTAIYDHFDSYAQAVLFGRTCKTLYINFLQNYKFKEFEAISLRTTKDILFFHAPQKTPSEFLKYKNINLFFDENRMPPYKFKKIKGPILLLFGMCLIFDAFFYIVNMISEIINEDSLAQKGEYRRQIGYAELVRCIEFFLGISALKHGFRATITGFTNPRVTNFDSHDFDEILENYLNLNTKIKTSKETSILIKLLKQAVVQNSLFEQSNSDVNNERVATAENSQKLKIL